MPSFGDKCKVFIKGSRPTSASSPHLVLRDLMMLAVICWAVVTVAPGTRYTQQLSLPASYSCIMLGLTCTVSGHTGHSPLTNGLTLISVVSFLLVFERFTEHVTVHQNYVANLPNTKMQCFKFSSIFWIGNTRSSQSSSSLALFSFIPIRISSFFASYLHDFR